MAGVLAAILCAVISAVAPAQASTPSKPARARSDVDEARRLYSIGEAELKKGHAPQAVSLWRRAIVLLPTIAEYDRLRHKLVLRLGHGMLLASEQTGEPRFAIDGARLLDRYLVQHEQLFGYGPDAERERGEVYELLYELDSKSEEAPAPPVEPEPPARVDEGAPDGMERQVVVPSKRKLGRTSVDDPQTVEKLKSDFTTPWAGLVLTRPDVEIVHAARGLVRVTGLTQAIGVRVDGGEKRALHELARVAVRSVRPELQRCFEAAFARTPTAFVQTHAELAIEPDGSVSSAEIVGAAIIDAAGTRCAAKRLADVQVDEGPAERVRLRVPLLFFWQDARYADEASGGRTIRSAIDFFGVRRELNHGSEGNLPSIERGVGIPR
ncbi:MAG TPA: hypothetical protein VG755_10775 [Nannocystaceae bacterium]|nr:hypothetical protein [Nannocystaceae bacterium]